SVQSTTGALKGKLGFGKLFGASSSSTTTPTPTTTTDHPPSVSNGAASTSKSPAVESTDSVTADKSPTTPKEEASLFVDGEVSPSKLVHLTAQRPKIPSSARRPPSLYVARDIELDGDSNGIDQSPGAASPDSEPETN